MAARVIIVGAGFSGAVLAAELAAQDNPPEIFLIDKTGRFGPGLAYGAALPVHALNAPAGRLSARADTPNDFAEWLCGKTGAPACAKLFASRGEYGAYLEALLRVAQAGSRRALKFVTDTAIACRTSSARVTVSLASGAKLYADSAVLGLGYLQATPPAPFREGDLINPWHGAAMAALPEEGDIALLGSGLTMIDAALSLSSRKGRLIALSRHGLAPHAHAEASHAPGEIGDLPLKLSDMLHAIRREVDAQGDWRAVMDRLRLEAPKLWRSLPLEAQKRFLRHARIWWDVHRHRAAPHVADEIAALKRWGVLRVVAGAVAGVRKSRDGLELTYRPRGARHLELLHVVAGVDCTGACVDLRRVRDDLVGQLIGEGLARAHPTGLGLDVAEDGRMRDRRGFPQRRLHALGPITQGAFWEATAAPEIRARAGQIAQQLAQPALQMRAEIV